MAAYPERLQLVIRHSGEKSCKQDLDGNIEEPRQLLSPPSSRTSCGPAVAWAEMATINGISFRRSSGTAKLGVTR